MTSDIPVGSPPVPPGRHAAPSGWYTDPVDPTQERYWDGWQWSRTTRVAERPPTIAPAQASQQPQPYQPYQPYQPTPQQPYAPPGVGGSRASFTADGVRLAGWWWRALAIVIDGLIVGVVAALLSFRIYAAMFGRVEEYVNRALVAQRQGLPIPPQPPTSDLIPTSDQVIVVAVQLAVQLVYLIGFLRWKSATPGKLAIGLRVVPVDQGRFVGPLPWTAIVPRTIVWVLGGTTAVFWLLRLIDVLFPLWHPKRQALHDLAARTQVVKIR